MNCILCVAYVHSHGKLVPSYMYVRSDWGTEEVCLRVLINYLTVLRSFTPRISATDVMRIMMNFSG